MVVFCLDPFATPGLHPCSVVWDMGLTVLVGLKIEDGGAWGARS